MAEIVQLHIEQMLPELEQLERVGLFKNEEIRTITRRRKALEYKLQRKKRSKQDYLSYIQYEIGVLDLIRKRRKKIGYEFKRKKIDYVIASRINRLFKAAIFKFQDDPNLWVSHIEFCKKLGWTRQISGMFLKMLQVHNTKPSLWLAAAKWEMKESNFETARKIFHRSLRFHPKSELLWQEYYRMELEFASELRRRKQVFTKIQDLKTKCDVPDVVIEGKIAMTVFDKAVEAVPDVNFVASFLPICAEFEFTEMQKEHIIQHLQSAFSEKEETWNIIARQVIITKDRSSLVAVSRGISKKLLKKACIVYEEALTTLSTEKMWGFYIQFLLEILSQCNTEKLAKKSLAMVLSVMERASAEDNLSMNYAFEWVKLLHSCHKAGKAKEVAVNSARKWSTEVDAWLLVLKLFIAYHEKPEIIEDLFEDAMSHIPKKKSKPLWELHVEWTSSVDATNLEALLEKAVFEHPESGPELKETLLEVTALVNGYSAARKLYRKLVNTRPVTPGLFETMIAIENAQQEPSLTRIRQYYNDALQEFGKDNVDLWMKCIEFESNSSGNLEVIGQLYWKAMSTLSPEESDLFISRFALLQAGCGLQLSKWIKTSGKIIPIQYQEGQESYTVQ